MSDADQDRLDRLRLIRSAQIGPITYFQLIRRFGTAAAALDAIPQLAVQGGGRAPRLASVADVAREVEAVDRLGARYLFVGQGLYPPLLAEIETAPPALIVKGNLRLLERPAVAMVGARNASAAGCRFARQLAHDLAEQNILIVSGLARGIDTAAHQGAGAENTVGVIASGIDISFPPENRELQALLAERGLVIAEQPPGREPLARHFPSRNRIIAGMALATVVVEAAPRSGSLITARMANENGRDVLAVPGSPLDPRAQGCNQLIREGATLIQNAADVIEAVSPIMGDLFRAPRPVFRGDAAMEDAADSDRRVVLDLLGPTPVQVDELIRLTGFPSAIVQTVLLELELGGRLERHAGGRVSLC